MLTGMTVARQALGIDVGGTGVKAAVVDLETGALVSERVRVKTPTPATPQAVAQVIARIVDRLAKGVELPPDLPVGCGLPGVVLERELVTAVNIGPGWSDEPAADVIGAAISRRVQVVNDADAAGLAEMRFGAGRDRRGTVIMLTLGTGIGSAVFVDGVLVPNTEFGHLDIGGIVAERRASALVRKNEGLSWEKWAGRLSRVLVAIEGLLWPDLFIIGGGVSRRHEKFVPLLQCGTPVVPATLTNDAGIVGAALAADGGLP
jgi:polyphosphate glucokinase